MEFLCTPRGLESKDTGGVPLGIRLSRSERKAALEPLAEFGGWGYGGVNRGRIVDVAGQNRLMLVCASADARIKRDQSVNATFAEQHPLASRWRS